MRNGLDHAFNAQDHAPRPLKIIRSVNTLQRPYMHPDFQAPLLDPHDAPKPKAQADDEGCLAFLFGWWRMK